MSTVKHIAKLDLVRLPDFEMVGMVIKEKGGISTVKIPFSRVTIQTTYLTKIGRVTNLKSCTER